MSKILIIGISGVVLYSCVIAFVIYLGYKYQQNRTKIVD